MAGSVGSVGVAAPVALPQAVADPPVEPSALRRGLRRGLRLVRRAARRRRSGRQGRRGVRADETRASRPRVDAIAGAAAGCLVTVFLHPIDTIKVLAQVGAADAASRNPAAIAARVLRDGGPLRLYSGLAPALASSAPISAIYTTAYEAVKRRLEPRVGPRRAWVAHCAGGAAASVATSVVYTPCECIKGRVQSGLASNAWQAFGQAWTSQAAAQQMGNPALAFAARIKGPLLLYSALPAVLLRNVPQSIVKFFAYEHLKAAFARHRHARAREGREGRVGSGVGSGV